VGIAGHETEKRKPEIPTAATPGRVPTVPGKISGFLIFRQRR